jgi:hypothetical protein
MSILHTKSNVFSTIFSTVTHSNTILLLFSVISQVPWSFRILVIYRYVIECAYLISLECYRKGIRGNWAAAWYFCRRHIKSFLVIIKSTTGEWKLSVIVAKSIFSKIIASSNYLMFSYSTVMFIHIFNSCAYPSVTHLLSESIPHTGRRW